MSLLACSESDPHQQALQTLPDPCCLPRGAHLWVLSCLSSRQRAAPGSLHQGSCPSGESEVHQASLGCPQCSCPPWRFEVPVECLVHRSRRGDLPTQPQRRRRGVLRRAGASVARAWRQWRSCWLHRADGRLGPPGGGCPFRNSTDRLFSSSSWSRACCVCQLCRIGRGCIRAVWGLGPPGAGITCISLGCLL